MKKVILSLVVVCACAYTSSAQNLKIDQQAGALKSYADVKQTGGNVLDLIQAGDMGKIITAQTAAAVNDNNIDIKQIGNFNATITIQEGTLNQITLSQDNQTGVIATPSLNGNGARLTQKGTENDLTVTQVSNAATAENKAGNTSTVEQDGATNAITLNQTSISVGHVATIKQLLATTNSSVTLGQTGALNTATLKQESGNLNIIEVTQANSDATLVGNTATMTQKGGNENEARLSQTGDENELTLTQTGNNNKLQLSGAAGSIALQAGSGNTATLTQTGDLNQIRFNQSGTDNIATVTQSMLN